MNDNPEMLNSIRKAVWTLVVLISILAVAGAAQITTNVYWWWAKGRHQPDQALRVVVAARDLPAGTVLQDGDIGMRSMKVGELPDHFVCVHMVRIMTGHSIHKAVKRGEPLDLEDTDLWKKDKESQPATAPYSEPAARSPQG
jgi:Flp pilus assembly protein CpaB